MSASPSLLARFLGGEKAAEQYRRRARALESWKSRRKCCAPASYDFDAKVFAERADPQTAAPVAKPAAESPIPPAARPIVEAVHRRYTAACGRGERPAIDDPHAAVGLLTALECIALAEAGYYPIPPAVIRLGMTPPEHLRQQMLDAVAAQLPDAVAAILETLEI